MLASVLFVLFISTAYSHTMSSSSTLSGSIEATSSSKVPTSHTISVAYAGFTFQPDVVLAETGDTVVFDFYPTNHSVVRAEYGYPCIPYEDTGVDKVGFFSGFKPVDAILSDPPKYTIRINDTSPVFYYCSAPGSCINYAMVGVINPNASTSLATQQMLARNSTFMLQPGEPWPSESDDPFPTSTSGSPAISTPAQPVTTSHSSSGVHPGAIAGIVIGVTALALLAAVLLYRCGPNSRNSRPASEVHYNPRQAYMSDNYWHGSYMTTPPVADKHRSTLTSTTALHPCDRRSLYQPHCRLGQSAPSPQPIHPNLSDAYSTTSSPQSHRSHPGAMTHASTNHPKGDNRMHTTNDQASPGTLLSDNRPSSPLHGQNMSITTAVCHVSPNSSILSPPHICFSFCLTSFPLF